MNKRWVVRAGLEHRRPPYVPWSFGFTQKAKEKLKGHYFPGRVAGDEELFETMGNYILKLGSDIGAAGARWSVPGAPQKCEWWPSSPMPPR